MLADYELASNCSNVSSERARTYYGRFSEHRYDIPRLENVRASTTAERKKPLLVTRATMLANGQSQIEPSAISRDEVSVKSRYEMRRKFFETLEHENGSATDSSALSRTKAARTNKGKNELIIFERNSTMGPSKNSRAHFVKLSDVQTLTNASTKKHVEYLNDETGLSNRVMVHSVARANIAQPSFVKRINIEETSSHHSIVSCVNGDSQTVEEIGHRERAKYPTIETVASIKTESSITGEDKLDSTVDTNNDEQHTTMSMDGTVFFSNKSMTFTYGGREKFQYENNNNKEETLSAMSVNTKVHSQNMEVYSHKSMTLTSGCAEIFQYDNSNNEEDPLSDLSSNICDGHSIDRYEYDEDKEALPANEINVEMKPAVEMNQTVRSWIESSIHESSWPNNEEIDSFESYCNDITKIVESIDMNVTLSRTELDALPDTDTCVKYNLDSTNMSLIYSLTPPAAVDQNESSNDDTLHDLTERSSEWQSDSTRSNNDESLSDYIWMEQEAPTMKAECVKSTRDRGSSSDSSYVELDHPVSDRHSASGSDILELPSCTIRELKDIDSEVFLNGINESANEIIADLNASDEELPSSDAVKIARHIIAEIIESIYVLLHLDSSIYDLSIVREMVRNLINNYRREYSLVESADRDWMSDVFTANNAVDNICRVKGFLGSLSSECDDYDQDYEMEIHEKEDNESPAVIEFCTVAKKLPNVPINNSALELNFRVVKVSSNKYANMSPSDYRRVFGGNSIDDDRGIKNSKTSGGESTTVIKPQLETWPYERCSYCREEEESIREKMSCLTPISEEPDDTLREVIDDLSIAPVLKNPDDIIEESMAANATKKHVSLDDTYTISDVSSVIISDNDEMNDLEEDRRDVWDSIDCMSYSYETKEFMRLEKALADSSQLNA